MGQSQVAEQLIDAALREAAQPLHTHAKQGAALLRRAKFRVSRVGSQGYAAEDRDRRHHVLIDRDGTSRLHGHPVIGVRRGRGAKELGIELRNLNYSV